METSSQISDELESQLIDLYFAWEQPWKQVVDEKLFRESKKSEGKYFSPLLLNSMLAFASRFCDNLEVRSDPEDPNTAGKLFLEKTETLLPFDMKWPSITTIQALAILGTLYCVSCYKKKRLQMLEVINYNRLLDLMRQDGCIKEWRAD